MTDSQSTHLDASAYGFDPTYGYTIEQLLNIPTPTEPDDFVQFWQDNYAQALTIEPNLEISKHSSSSDTWQIFDISYQSTDQVTVQGWLLLPLSGVIRRGFIVGHGYGGRDAPDLHLPFKNAALLFPCFRGLGKSKNSSIPSEPYQHVLHQIESKQSYVIKGCVEDLWLAVSGLLNAFPELKNHLGYLGISFGGGIGALALPWDLRIRRGHLNVPTFGQHPLRLRLKTLGSAHSIQNYYSNHKKSALKILRYFDSALAAHYFKIPMHFACAQFDPCVAPPGQFAIYNATPDPKQLFVLDAGHHSYPAQNQQEQELLTELERFFEPL